METLARSSIFPLLQVEITFKVTASRQGLSKFYFYGQRLLPNNIETCVINYFNIVTTRHCHACHLAICLVIWIYQFTIFRKRKGVETWARSSVSPLFQIEVNFKRTASRQGSFRKKSDVETLARSSVFPSLQVEINFKVTTSRQGLS